MKLESYLDRDFEFIAEAGVNHEGRIEVAKRMIYSASNAGVNCIKFQSYKKEYIAAKNSPSYWDLKSESTNSQYELFGKYDSFEIDDYLELAEICAGVGIEFMTTCFDSNMVNSLAPVLKRFKIASADITNKILIQEIASKGKPIIISTGASEFIEVSSAINWIKEINNRIPITLLHCVLNYPTNRENANLLRIQKLKEEFPSCHLGYSDHTKPKDSNETILLAYALGARIFEKHFTLDKKISGNDHYHSYDESDLKEILIRLKYAKEMLNYSEEKFILSQIDARKFARISLYASRTSRVGQTITKADLIALRPTIETNGFYAFESDLVQGRIAICQINKGDPILKSSLSGYQIIT